MLSYFTTNAAFWSLHKVRNNMWVPVDIFFQKIFLLIFLFVCLFVCFLFVCLFVGGGGDDRCFWEKK